MLRSQSSDHHQGSITVLVQLLLIGVHASSYSSMWLYVVCASVHTMYLSVWCLVMYCIIHQWDLRSTGVWQYFFIWSVSVASYEHFLSGIKMMRIH